MEPLTSKDPKSVADFTLIGRLGSGGMGIVYLASRRSENAALKVIRDSLIDNPSEATRFAREVETLKSIDSPNVARILDSGEEDGRAWFAVEFVNGPDLSKLVGDKGPLSQDDWWDLAAGLLRGLADIHEAGIIHRDIKPANVIMSESGPKVIDFGIAHISEVTSVTATGLVAGSPAWFSPEQIEGQLLTFATDVFSLGSLLTFAGGGKTPWGYQTTMTKASVFRILTEEPDLNELTPQQSKLISYMLEKSPSARPSAQWLLSRLDSIRAGDDVGDWNSTYLPDETTTIRRLETEKPKKVERKAERTGVRETKRTERKSKLVPVFSILVVLVLSFSGFWGYGNLSVSSGPVTVVWITDVSEGNLNPPIGETKLLLSSGPQVPAEVSYVVGGNLNSQPTGIDWKSNQEVRVAFTPPFSEDEPYDASFVPADFGFNGFSGGNQLRIIVEFKSDKTEISFNKVSDSNDESVERVFSVALSRGNEAKALSSCRSELRTQTNPVVNSFKGLYSAYLADEAEVNLNGAFYANEWESKFKRMASRVSEDRKFAVEKLKGFEYLQPSVQQYIDASVSMEDALNAMRELAANNIGTGRSIPDDPWSDVWDAYWIAESLLSSATTVGLDERLESRCSELIQ